MHRRIMQIHLHHTVAKQAQSGPRRSTRQSRAISEPTEEPSVGVDDVAKQAQSGPRRSTRQSRAISEPTEEPSVGVDDVAKQAQSGPRRSTRQATLTKVPGPSMYQQLQLSQSKSTQASSSGRKKFVQLADIQQAMNRSNGKRRDGKGKKKI